jgi:2-polyprenyl-3-methyl-5-hydroxy-6-metoxy-1,4-benzoquinol methylase
MPDESCPSCGAGGAEVGEVVERHRDGATGTQYEMRRCSACGLTFARPRLSVGADWYAAMIPDEEPLPPDRDWRFLEFLRDAPPRARVLDVGCGEGQFLRLARERGLSGVGFDWDERRAARARAAGLETATEDWERFLAARPDAEFDAAVLFDVLEHAPEPSVLVRGLRRLLKPGGLLAITVPNESRPLPFGRENYDYPPHHFTRWTRTAMKAFLEREGFEIVRQDASMRASFYFRDVVASKLAIEPAARLLRRLRGAAGPPAGAAPGPTAHPARSGARTALFALFSGTVKTALWPAAALAVRWYGASRPDPGHCLYTLARKP